MRFTILTAMVVCAFPAAATETDAEALQRLSREWMQAIERKDEPALQAFLAPEYVLSGAGDALERQIPRELWIANALKMDWSGFRYENFDVRVQGDHAVVNSKLSFHVAPMPFELDSGVVDTWARRDGRWQVTGRYLGESSVQLRIRFWTGFGSALLLVALGWAVVKVKRRLAG